MLVAPRLVEPAEVSTLLAVDRLKVVLIANDIRDYSLEYAGAIARYADVTLMVASRMVDDSSRLPDLPSLEVVSLDWPRHRQLKNLTFMPTFLRAIREAKPDIIHVLTDGQVWLNAILPFIRDYPVITTVHDVTYHPGDRSSRKVPHWLKEMLVRNSTGIIVHGEQLKEQAARSLPIEARRIHTLPHIAIRHYADLAERAGLVRRDPEQFNVLFFGRIYGYKGLEYLIDAVPEIAGFVPDLKVTIAGQGEGFDRYRERMTDYEHFFDIRNRFIDDLETAQLFTDADLVVLPYVEASQSGVLAIANSFGKPTVVTDVGELPESVSAGGRPTGLIVPPRDASALAVAITRLNRDRYLRESMGENALRHAESKLSAKTIGARALSIYRRVLAERR